MIGEPPPPAPLRSASPRRRRVKRIVMVVGVVLACMVLLCCAGGAYLLYDAHRAPGEEQAMEAVATDLCHDLMHGDADAVYAAMSAGARDRYSLPELAQGLADRGRSTVCTVVRATYLFLLAAYVEIEDAHGRHSFDLVQEAGEWKVDGDILHDLDTPSRHGHGGGGIGDGD